LVFRRSILGVLLVAVVAAACSSNSEDARANLVAATTSDIMRSQNFAQSPTKDDAHCVATALVDAFGVKMMHDRHIDVDRALDLSVLRDALTSAVTAKAATLLRICNLGAILGLDVNEDFQSLSFDSHASARSTDCFIRRLSSTSANALLVDVIISGLDNTSAIDIARKTPMLIDCGDWASQTESQVHEPLSSNERSCADRVIRSSSAFRAALVAAIQHDREIEINGVLQTQALNCLSASHVLDQGLGFAMSASQRSCLDKRVAATPQVAQGIKKSLFNHANLDTGTTRQLQPILETCLTPAQIQHMRRYKI
jgi:hypothetical protein